MKSDLTDLTFTDLTLTTLTFTTLQSPVGELTIVARGEGLVKVAFASPAEVLPEFSEAAPPGSDDVATRARDQLAEYFTGRRRDFDVPIDWSRTRGTQCHVLRTLVEQVPFGETVSYRSLAEMSGYPGAARAVGGIMGSNPFPLIVPCHRVLASGGGLGGFGPGLEAKRRLLVLEGVLDATLLELDMLAG